MIAKDVSRIDTVRCAKIVMKQMIKISKATKKSTTGLVKKSGIRSITPTTEDVLNGRSRDLGLRQPNPESF